jgi:hypothetical protein
MIVVKLRDERSRGLVVAVADPAAEVGRPQWAVAATRG